MAHDEIVKNAGKRMDKSIEAIKHEMAKIRTGRAHPSLLDHITVSYYGSDVPLSQVSNITIQDARTLAINAWDRKSIPDIEKAILTSDLGLNPISGGDVIRIPLPALTEDRRKELIKVVRHEAEMGRVAIRNIRRDANHMLKELVKEKEITEDAERRAEESIQKLTTTHIGKIDQILGEKEKELMEI